MAVCRSVGGARSEGKSADPPGNEQLHTGGSGRPISESHFRSFGTGLLVETTLILRDLLNAWQRKGKGYKEDSLTGEQA